MAEHWHRQVTPDVLATRQRPPSMRTVMAVTFLRGEGCCADDPVRECTAFYESDGTLVGVIDPTPTTHIGGNAQ